MCTQIRDENKVVITGQAVGDTLKFYKAKGQPRCEFLLRSNYDGSITKIVVQFRGQKAHDAFALYEAGRRFKVIGRLKYRRGGRWCVVATKPFSVGDKMGETAEDTLIEKIKAIQAGRPKPVVEEEKLPDPEEKVETPNKPNVDWDALAEAAQVQAPEDKEDYAEEFPL